MRTSFLHLSILLCCAGCNKAVEPGNVPSYPLIPLAEWKYSGIDSTYNFRPISPGTMYHDTVIHSSSIVKCLGEHILRDTIHTIAMQATEAFDSLTPYVATNFYTTTNDSLFLYAYDGGGSASFALPKKSLVKYTFNGKTFNSIRELTRHYEGLSFIPTDDIIYEAKPPKVMVFPLRTGTEWTYRAHGYPFFIGKKILGYESIPVPAGQFVAYKIQWSWDFDGNNVPDSGLVGYDYVTSNGLLKRTFLFTNLALTVDDPEPIGYIDLKHEYVVTSFRIPEIAIASY
ncbi:MAG TPA: hypothetical protein VGR15_06380 [Bacteroidota bacterium]|nr:hypothetical protein [Bacteroidota bacterium]